MKRCGMQLLTAYIVATWFLSAPAGADILIESHDGQRPPDADPVLAAFRAELESAGVKIRPADVLAVAGDQLPSPGSADPTLGREYTIGLDAQVSRGTTQVLRGDYAAGMATLENVLARARTNADVVVTDPASYTWLTKAYAALAFAHIRTQHPDAATEAVAEQIRSFPEDPIGRIVGPEVAALAIDVRKALDTAPHGTLRVIVTRPDVDIYIDERLRATGRSLTTVVPGRYRLLLRQGGSSRRYAVRVLPDKNTDLYIDWDADLAFRAADTWIGFSWPLGQGDKTAGTVPRYARGSRQHDVLVVSIVERETRRFLVGSIFEKHTGALLRTKAIALDGNDDGCKRALAHYLLSGNADACLLDMPTQAAPRPHVLANRPPQRSRTPIYAAAGTAAAAFIAGAYLFHLDGSGTCGAERAIDCPLIYSARGPAWSVIGVGVAAVGFGVYWHFRVGTDAQPSATVSLSPMTQGALARVEGTF